MAAVIRLLRPSSSSSSFPLLSRSLSTAAASETVKSHAYLQKHLSPGVDPKSRNIQWVFLGCPGVGKGTYASRLSILLGVPHIATGDLVREELNSPTPLSTQVRLFYTSYTTTSQFVGFHFCLLSWSVMHKKLWIFHLFWCLLSCVTYDDKRFVENISISATDACFFPLLFTHLEIK